MGFECLHKSHSAQALGSILIEDVQKFQVVDAIRAITADSASVNTTMFCNLEREGHLSGFKQEDSHICYMGHVINLAIQSLLKTLQTIAIQNEAQLADEEEDTRENEGTQLSHTSYKTCKIIAKVRSSNQLWESLPAQAQAARIPIKQPILDMPIRWNSTYTILEPLLALHPAIYAVCR